MPTVNLKILTTYSNVLDSNVISNALEDFSKPTTARFSLFPFPFPTSYSYPYDPPDESTAGIRQRLVVPRQALTSISYSKSKKELHSRF